MKALNLFAAGLSVLSAICLLPQISLLKHYLPEPILVSNLPPTVHQLPPIRLQQTIMSGESSVTPLQNLSQPDRFTELQIRNLAKASVEEPLVVFLFPLHMNNTKYLIDELKHFIHDGVRNSPYMTVSTNNTYNTSDLWIAQTILGFPPSKWCRRVEDNIRAVNHRQPKQWIAPLILMDWHDNADLFGCPSLLRIMGKESIVYTKRGVVAGRRYNTTSKEIELGHIEQFSNWSVVSGAPIRHTPYAVRSDFVHSLEQVLQVPNNLVEFDVVGLSRPKDVAHFWPRSGGKVDRGGRKPNSRLRDSVSGLLEQLQQEQGLQVFAKLTGSADTTGRNQVDLSYPRTIVEYKIVVVAQKDSHEEHYRLMEAIASGALVMSDVMLTIPKDFVDGESIVFYRNMSELKSKIMYYLEHAEERLAIARKGWTLAMNRHRSWHLMEEVVFGRQLSPAIV